jgi:hypothetical protein
MFEAAAGSEFDVVDTTLGELVAALYEAALEELGDPELAAVATSALLQERFAEFGLDGADITLAA